MARFLVALLLIAVLYVMWDRGTFGYNSGRVYRDVEGVDGRSTAGPAERVGEVLDRGLAKAGRVVQDAGRNLEKAAEGKPETPPDLYREPPPERSSQARPTP